MYDLFSDFFDGFDIFSTMPTYKPETRCPVCGRSFSDFQKIGKLGCAACYEVFKYPLSSTLKQIHQNPIHKGKIPSHGNIKLKKQRLLDDLKQQLSKAVRNEDYETAARLHKEIKKMENSKGE